MKTLNHSFSYLLIIIILAIPNMSCINSNDGKFSIIERPETSQINDHYVSNRAPLKPSALIKLPIGAIEPGGWLGEYLIRQKNGLTGNLGKISAWLQKEDNAWLSKEGKVM